jgi:hypothetical protein
MTTETLIAIRNNPYYYKFLRENSSWYKLLNRDINNLKLMDEEVKKYYKLNFSDKLSDINNKISMLRTFMDIIN